MDERRKKTGIEGRRGVAGRTVLSWLAASLLCMPLVLSAGPASALSEIGREDLPPPAGTPGATPPGESEDPLASPPADEDPADGEEKPQDIARPDIDENGPLPEVIYNLDRLPEPVRRMHGLLMEAARSGEIERLRPLIGTGDSVPQLSFGEHDGDPVEFLKSLSGDPEGQEILAIMEEVLDAGFVHLEAGTPDELYVWPYFFGLPLDKLDARQRVELFKIVTAGDLEDMKQFGAYIFYRLGITPEGRWAFFVAGE
jgi:hypothetical protein